MESKLFKGKDAINSMAPKESREKEPKIDSVVLFVVRHGKTQYLERDNVIRTGKWKPELYDITEEAEKDLDETTENLSKELNPDKHIVVFFSSPRARALRSREQLEQRLREKGFEVLEQDPIVEILRSGGDQSPLVGKDKSLEFEASAPDYDIATEDEQETHGVRFREFLSYFTAIDKDKLVEKIKDPQSEFHGKIPVFVGVTHGEVTHAGINPRDQYEDSFLGRAFPEYKRMKLFRGKAMKLEFNLEKPGDIVLTLPAEMSPRKKEEKKKLHFDSRAGQLSLIGALNNHI